jgi:hypothetical protein
MLSKRLWRSELALAGVLNKFDRGRERIPLQYLDKFKEVTISSQ